MRLENSLITKLEEFFSQTKPLSYNKRDLILQAEENIHHIFYIKEGYGRVYRISEDGEELTLTILKAGDLFPLTFGGGDLNNHYYLEALTSLELWRAPQEEFLKFIRTEPELFYELSEQTSFRVGGLLRRIEYLVFGNAYTKVAATLLACGRRFGLQYGEGVVVNLPLTHKDIATLVGITRETTCLEMRKLEKKGLISHYGKLLVVKSLKRLEEESLISNETEPLLDNLL